MTSQTGGLTNMQQAWLMFAAMLLGVWTPVLDVWFNAGMPTNPTSLGALFVGLIAGFGAALAVWMKEALGIVVPPVPAASH
jgi:uncharacterized membrane-anchored protein YitT (DUF2179 family)